MSYNDLDLTTRDSHLDGKSLTKPLRILSTVIPSALLVADRSGWIVATSPSWKASLGPLPAGTEPRLSDLEGELSVLARLVDETIESMEPRSIRSVINRAIGPASYEFRVAPWVLEDETCGGALVMALDVTVEERNRRRLVEANERYNLLIDGASVGIWDWFDVENDEEYWSPRFYELLGYEDKELTASLTMFKSLLHPHDVAPTFEAVNAHFDTGKPFEVEYRLRTKLGEYRWFAGRGVAARDESGTATRMVGSIQAIDDRVTAQRKLEQANEDLAHFARVAAHDLREPAKRQRMLIGFLLDEHGASLAEEVVRDLERIRDQSDAMLAMIAGFRALSSFEGSTVERAQVDLAELAGRLARELLNDAAVTIDLPTSVDCYPALTEILLRNTFTNAVKHGSTPLVVHVGSEQRNDGDTWYSVSNSWVGDRSSVTDDLFKPFVGRATDDGTGLGLSICKRVVQHHKGQIEVEAEAGLFTVSFTLTGD